MKKTMNILTVLLFTTVGSISFADTMDKLQHRAENSAAILRQIVAIPDDTIPESLLAKATCVVTFPNVIRIGLVFGARYGKGLASCRVGGAWSSPSIMKVTGGSWGLQAGISSTDLILVFTRPSASDRLSKSNFTLGGDATVAVGPVGRHLEAGTDYQLKSEIFAYSKSRGLFAGLTIEGAAMVVDTKSNALIYGKDMTAERLLTTVTRAPSSVETYVNALMETAP